MGLDARVRRRRLLAVATLVAGCVTLVGRPALAACHRFSLDVSPTSVAEGGKVTVGVSRDNNVGPSNVDVSTVDGTAKAGKDYTALNRTVSFTTDTAQSFTVSTTDDSSDEPAETFRVQLSNPGGCDVNPDFSMDAPVTVTIRDNDPAPAGTPSKPPVTTTPSQSTSASASPSPTASASASVAPSESPSASPSPTPSPTESVLAAPEETTGGLSGGAVAGIVAGVSVAGGASAFWLLRRRRRS